MNPGKEFEDQWKDSCKEQHVLYRRVKDFNIPPDLRERIKVSPNPYDNYIFSQGIFIPLELKSTSSKSISFDEKIIKKNQIKGLLEDSEFSGTAPGFVFNFRGYSNKTLFVHIKEFIAYKSIAEGGPAIRSYQSKINKSSIPLGICEEIGISIDSELKRVKYRYDVLDLVKSIKEKYLA